MIIVCQCVEEARTYEDVVALYLDELTFYQRPSIACGWELRGKPQPLARWGFSGSRKSRVVATVDVSTGAVIFDQQSKIGVDALVTFCSMIRRRYPTARTIYVIRDNCSVHDHPKVLQAAIENNIHFVPLPTYAPWTNPVEKLWRWLYQTVLHLHRQADHWERLKQRVNSFLEQFEHGSEDLLRYVGLANGRIPAAPHNWNESVGRLSLLDWNENEPVESILLQTILPN